jgi:hypothetical protein
VIAERPADEVEVLYFDQIGAPPVEQVVTECGSGEAWQRAKTLEWMARGSPRTRSERPALLEGQAQLSFLAEGAQSLDRGAGVSVSGRPSFISDSFGSRVRRPT